MLPKSSPELSHLLRESGHHVTIETAGTIDRKIDCDLMSISPKFASSRPDPMLHPRWAELHAKRRMPLGTMRRLIERSKDYQLKFVVNTPADYDELLEVVDRLQVPAGNVWVMPQGTTNEAMDSAATWLRAWCDEQQFRYCDRMQIRWFGNRRGT